MTTPSTDPITNPYVGPRTFTEQEGRFFFGREREARDLTARIVSERLLLFYAQSGAGKSSLLHARVIAKLRDEERFQVLPVGRVSGELPVGVGAVDSIYAFNLMTSLHQGDEQAVRLAHVTLSDFLARLARETVIAADGQRSRRWVYKPDLVIERPAAGVAPVAPGPRFVLIIDQFEELITSHPGRWREREAFFRQLNQALLDDPNLWVVLTLREDYVPALDPYAELTFNRLRARFYMERMDRDAALEATCRPAELGGRPFVPGVAEQLVDNLRLVRVPGQEAPIPGQYVEPVQLQVVCYQMWEGLARGDEGRSITFDDLAQAGDVDRALTQFYEETLAAALAEPAAAGVSERQLRTWFNEELITEAGTRGLVHQGEQATGSLPNAIIRKLQSRFLVRGETRSGDTWIELVHDRFIEPIRQSNRAWLDRNLNPLTQAAQAWCEAGRSPASLYAGSQLTAAVSQLQASPLEFGDLEQEFVEESEKAEARRAARQQLTVTWGAIALSLIFIALAIWALWSRTRAQGAATNALNTQATAEAFAHMAAISEVEARKAEWTAVAAQIDAEAAKKEAEVAAAEAQGQKVTAEAYSTVAAFALARYEANLEAALTAQAPSVTLPTSTSSTTATLSPMITPDRTQTSFLPPTSTGTPTPNQTVVAQQNQLVAVRATQTVLASARAATQTPTPEAGIVEGFSGRLAFLSKRLNNRSTLFLTELGSRQPAICLQPNLIAYSPSGTTTSDGVTILVFSSADWEQPGGQLYWTGSTVGDDVMKIGDAPRESRWQPSISPDGHSVLFVSNWEGNHEIYSVNLDGTNVVNLTRSPTNETSPAWSPDGQRIAFASKREGGQADIWTMSTDGSDWKRLTSHPNTDTFPAWSPNGRYLAFASNQDDPTNRHPDIFVLDLVSNSLRNLTNTPGMDENFPTWSRGGTWIAFTRYTTNSDIYVMPATGGSAINVTNLSAEDSYPIWLP